MIKKGVEDMLFAAKGHPERVLPNLHNIVRPLRNALSKYDTDIVLAVCKVINMTIAQLYIYLSSISLCPPSRVCMISVCSN